MNAAQRRKFRRAKPQPGQRVMVHFVEKHCPPMECMVVRGWSPFHCVTVIDAFDIGRTDGDYRYWMPVRYLQVIG